jgi:outer membrane lipoprotein-sorting protein
MKKTILPFLLILLSFTQLYAQTAEEVVDIYLKKVGGTENLRKITTIKMEGTASSQGMDLSFTVLSKGKNKYKSYLSFDGMEIVQPASYDGKNVWNTNITNMQSELLEGEAAEAIIREVKDFPDPLLTYKENGYSVELGREETIKGRSCFQLILVKPDFILMGQQISGKTSYYIDKENGMILKKMQSSGQAMNVSTFLSDYRPVQGIFFPFKMETEIGDFIGSSINFKTIQVNSPIDDLLFAYPK